MPEAPGGASPAAPDPSRSFPTSGQPDHWNYWRREALAYHSGLAATASYGQDTSAAAARRVTPWSP